MTRFVEIGKIPQSRRRRPFKKRRAESGLFPVKMPPDQDFSPWQGEPESETQTVFSGRRDDYSRRIITLT